MVVSKELVMMSLVSIIVPCYNQAQYLDEALKSVFEQTYTNWECIIVNDGSPDHTEEVAKKWLKKDSRFKYFYKENGGLSSARNAGLEIATGNYIQFLDSDDVLHIEKLSLSLAECDKVAGNSPKIIISNFRMFTDDISLSTNPFCELKQEYFTFNEMLFGWDYRFNIPVHCGFFEATLFEYLKFPEELKAKEDWIMWLEVFKKNPDCFFIDKPLVYYRTHLKSMTKDFKHMEENYFIAIMCLKSLISEEEFFEYLLFVFQKRQGEIINLKVKINNIKNSKGYSFLEKIKKLTVVKFILKVLK